MWRTASSWDPEKRLVELSEGYRHFMQAGVYFAEDGVGFVFSVGEALAGVASRENFDALFDGGDRVEMELAFGDRFDYFFAQHQVVHIFRGYQDPLISREAFHFADVVEAFDFLVHAADWLDISLLIYRAGDGQFLADGDARKRREQRVNFGGAGAIAVHAGIGLLEAETGGKRERFILREGPAHVTGNDVHAFIVEAAAEIRFALDIDDADFAG